jgi:hypothetical protein
MTPSADLDAQWNIRIWNDEMDGRPARYYDEVYTDASISVVAPTIGHVKLLTVLSILVD